MNGRHAAEAASMVRRMRVPCFLGRSNKERDKRTYVSLRSVHLINLLRPLRHPASSTLHSCLLFAMNLSQISNDSLPTIEDNSLYQHEVFAKGVESQVGDHCCGHFIGTYVSS
jgi:hypothetical protein